MPSITFPFDFNPTAGLTVSTGNYTVPADTYVHVAATPGTTALVVDGTTIVEAENYNQVNQTGSYSGVTTTVVYTNSEVATAEVQLFAEAGVTSVQYVDGAVAVDIENLSPTAGQFQSGIILVRENGTLQITHSAGGSLRVAGRILRAEPQATEFWAPTGTTINGGRKIISEYDV